MNNFKRVQVNSVLYLTLIILMCFSLNSFAFSKRIAKVAVYNQTGKDIFTVNVAHKYSDNYKNDLTATTVIKNGQIVSLPGYVKYHTGAFTTGKDWWYIHWTYVNENGSILYYSSPNNFRHFIDSMENATSFLLSAIVTGTVALAGAACGGITVGACSKAAIFGVAAAIQYSGSITDQMLNSEKTAGFKQHILRDRDENRTVLFTLYNDGNIRISSPSGTSWTRYKSKKVPVMNTRRIFCLL